MSVRDPLSDTTPTLDIETFWEWLGAHPNCVLRAGTRDAVVFDDDDFHWQFTSDGATGLLAQVIRGKRLVGEILIPRQLIAYVQGAVGDHEGEFVFELVSSDDSPQSPLFFFVLTHGYEPQEETDPRRVH